MNSGLEDNEHGFGDLGPDFRNYARFFLSEIQLPKIFLGKW